MNNLKTLKQGQKITFRNDFGVFTRKIQDIYICSFNTEVIKYNTRGLNGGFGCDGFSVEPNEIIKVY
jgi:hypothetical protein